MRFTLAWLKEHLETTATLEEIVARLTAIGLEVDRVEDRGKALAPFRVAQVLTAAPHPNADRLRVCSVDAGAGAVQVVCGAPNARAGMKAVFAAAGSVLPGTGLTLKPSKIRGVESNGMLVSERELGLSDEHEGIIELPAEAKPGEPFAAALGLDDPVIDLELTPNRPDCAGVRGIARDLAAAGLGRLKPLARGEAVAGSYVSPLGWAIAPDGNACPFVVGRHFSNLRNGPSPRWLQQRLRAIGLRPICALVDITNFVTIDLGRPLHVFDAGKITGATLSMRRARLGEELAALNGKRYALDDSMTVIADAAGVQGLGGVMGGAASGVSETSTEIFLEVALFDPVAIARTGRRLDLASDARYRFERGVDPQSAPWGAEVAARLILDLCGGAASRTVTAGTLPEHERRIALRRERVAGLGGVELPPARQRAILEALGFAVEDTPTGFAVTPPSWRPDLSGEPDLVEEIVRIHGIDNVPAVVPARSAALPQAALTPAQRRVTLAKRALALRGLYEAVTFSFTGRAAAEAFGGGAAELLLTNPISAELDAMRPSLLPNLALAARRNADRGHGDVALFEVGPQYRDATPQGQALVAGVLRAGRLDAEGWPLVPRAGDALDAKADALAALEAIGAPVEKLAITRDAPRWYHPGRSGTLRLGAAVLAWFGELNPRVAASFGLKGAVVAAEVFLDAAPLPRSGRAARAKLEPSPYQAVRRDFAFVVDDAVAAEVVLKAARGADKALVAAAQLFDVYAGAGVPAGKKSLAIGVVLQPTAATLTEAEIEAAAARIVAAVARATGGTLRS